MATITISLKNKKAEKSPIWAVISDGRGINLKVYSGFSIKTKHWSKANKCVLSANNESVEINRSLKQFKKDVLGAYLDAKSNGIKANSAYIREALKPKEPIKEVTFWGLWDSFLESKRGIFKKHSFTKFGSLAGHLKAFEENRKLNFSLGTLSQELMEDLQNFLYHSQDLNTQSTSKYIGIFKIFLNWCVKRKHTANTDFKYFTPINQPDSLKVVITNEELSKIKTADLGEKEYLKNVRELFTMSCLTGLRYSDYSRVNIQHLKQDGDGGYILLIRQQKTEDFVELPLTPEALNIVEKLITGDVHPISNQKMNTYVKELCVIAEINEPFEVNTYKGKDKKTEIFEKHKLITTHTGRRTFATNLLNKGVPAEIVMQFTGHRDYKSFAKYVNIPKKTQMEVVKKALLGNSLMKVSA